MAPAGPLASVREALSEVIVPPAPLERKSREPRPPLGFWDGRDVGRVARGLEGMCNWFPGPSKADKVGNWVISAYLVTLFPPAFSMAHTLSVYAAL